VIRIRHSAAVVLLAVASFISGSVACAQDPPAGGRSGRRGGDTSQAKAAGGKSEAGAKGEAGAQPPGRGGAPGGRGGARTASIVLGPTDVAKAARGQIEATIAISGDLKAFDLNTVRSRVDGVIEKVFVREGQMVAAGTLLAKFESSEQEATLRSADADVLAAKNDLETQEWNAEQSRTLFKAGAIAERDLKLAEQAVDASKARHAAAEARQRTASNVLRDTRVTAPFAGAIEKRMVQDGENTPRGTQMFTIVRTTTLELVAALPARSADLVKAGQSVRFTADGRSFTGKVARVSPTIDPASRSIAVYVTVPNPRGLLKGNTFASGQLVTTVISDALVLPVSAIRDNADGTRRFVYKILGGELTQATVQVGITDESRQMVQVLDGVRDQDQVVIGNPGTLGAGMKVTIIGPEAGRGGGRRGQKSAP
jgi:membrane fusion protein (multidrug efflux system)